MLWFVIGVLIVVAVLLGLRSWALEKALIASLEAASKFEALYDENDDAWRKGQDDLEDNYRAQLLTAEEDVYKMEIRNANMALALDRLEQLHANHQDHCLPVLATMRDEFSAEHDTVIFNAVRDAKRKEAEERQALLMEELREKLYDE